MTRIITRVHPVHLMNVDWARVAATLRPSQLTWAVNPPKNWQLPSTSTSTIAIVIITQSIRWYSFCRPTEGKRLSRSRHCSKCAQPVPKAVYRSSCHDKHNRPQCDSNPGPLTPQSDALTTRLLRPAPIVAYRYTVVAWFCLFVCLCVCWSRLRTVLKRLNRSTCCLRYGFGLAQKIMYSVFIHE